MAEFLLDYQFREDHAKAFQTSIAPHLDAGAIQELGGAQARSSSISSDASIAYSQAHQESSALLRSKVETMLVLVW